MNAMLPRAEVEKVYLSYGRCCQADGFFRDFYAFFMSKSDDVRAMFNDTDMAEQRRLLRSGLTWLIMYARGGSDFKLRQLGETHSRKGYGIRPEWYDLWVEALLEAVREHDPELTPSLEAQWRKTLQPGVDMIRGAY